MATIYVDQASGSDSNDGSTFALAKLTLSAALTAAGVSGTVIGSGRFEEAGTVTAASGFTIQQNAGKDQFIIDGRRTLAGSWADETGCYSTALANANTVACCVRGDLTYDPTKGWYFPILKLVADVATCKSTDWSCARVGDNKLYVRLSGGGSGTAPVNTGVATALRWCASANGLTFATSMTNSTVSGLTFWCNRGSGKYGCQMIAASGCVYQDNVHVDTDFHGGGFVTGPTRNNIARRNVFIGMGSAGTAGVVSSGFVFHGAAAGDVTGCIEEDSSYVVRGPVDPTATEIYPAIGQYGMEAHGTAGLVCVNGLIRRRITVEIQDPGSSGLRYPWTVNDSLAPTNTLDPTTAGVQLQDITLINGGSFTVAELGHYSIDRLHGDLLQYGPRHLVDVNTGAVAGVAPVGTATTYCTIRDAEILVNTDYTGHQGHAVSLVLYENLTLINCAIVDVGHDATAALASFFNWNAGAGVWTGIQLSCYRCLFVGSARKNYYLNVFDNGLPVAQQVFSDCEYVNIGATTYSQDATRNAAAEFVGAGMVDVTGTVGTNAGIVVNARLNARTSHAAEGYTTQATTNVGQPSVGINVRTSTDVLSPYSSQRGPWQDGPVVAQQRPRRVIRI